MKARKRSGIGTVIASAIMLFLMIFTIGQLYIYSIDELDSYNRAASQVYAVQAQKQGEHLTITNAQLGTMACLSQAGTCWSVALTFTNNGAATSQVKDVWIDDLDASTNIHALSTVSSAYVPAGGSLSLPPLASNTPSTGAASIDRISIKAVTALGNTYTASILPPGRAGTTAQTLATVSLTIDPPNPITSNDIIVILTVTNNNQLGVGFSNIQPDICVNQGSTSLSSSTCSYSSLYGTASVSETQASPPQICDVGGGYNPQTPVACTFLPGQNQISTGASTSVDSCTVIGSTDTCKVTNPSIPASSTIYVYSSWNTPYTVTSSPTGGSFSVPFPTSSAVTGTTFSWSVGPSVSPSTLSFLPYGSTAVFQWTFEADSSTPDQPVTIQASYASLATPNLCSAAGACGANSPAQVATAVAIVRGSGGTSANVGGSQLQTFGNLVSYFSSFQYSQDGTNWHSGFSMPGNTRTLFRINFQNLGSSTITVNSTTVFTQLNSLTGAVASFYIMAPCAVTGATTTSFCFNGGTTHVFAYPSTRTTISPGATIPLYFGSSAPGGTSSSAVGSSGNSWFSVIIIIGSTGTNSAYSQSIPPFATFTK